jgi:hypothetical protein
MGEDRASGGLLACAAPGDHLPEIPICGDAVPPARTKTSSFGNDAELVDDLPPNWTLSRFQTKVKSVLTEYFVCPAVDDAASQVGELLADCPSEADELGVLAIRAAVDNRQGGDKPRRAVVQLLSALHRSNVLDRPALIRSFEKLFCTWEDMAIDAPTAPESLLEILYGCITEGMVDRTLLTKLPENLLDAGLAKAGADYRDMLAGMAAELKEFKKQAAKALEEYYVALNAEEVGVGLRELSMQPYHHEFVKKAITLSFTRDKEEKAREAALTLLTHLTSAGILAKDDLQWGVTRLLGQLDDLELDCPRCVELAVEFIAGMVEDELVSIPFLRRCRLLRIGGPTGLRVLDMTQRKTPEYSKRHLGKTQFKRELHTMILEYFDSGDLAEFGRCVRDLSPLSTEQGAEIIRKVMVLAMERSGSECDQALRLLVWLCRQEELDQEKMEHGFDDLYAKMPDIELDVPDARDMARTFVVEAQKAGVLPVLDERLGEWPDPSQTKEKEEEFWPTT